MDPITYCMNEICGQWSGKFADRVKNLVSRCVSYDDSFARIEASLSASASRWQTEAARSKEEEENSERYWGGQISSYREHQREIASRLDKLRALDGNGSGGSRRREPAMLPDDRRESDLADAPSETLRGPGRDRQ